MEYCVIEEVEQRPGQWCLTRSQIAVTIVNRKRMTHIERCINWKKSSVMKRGRKGARKGFHTHNLKNSQSCILPRLALTFL